MVLSPGVEDALYCQHSQIDRASSGGGDRAEAAIGCFSVLLHFPEQLISVHCFWIPPSLHGTANDWVREEERVSSILSSGRCSVWRTRSSSPPPQTHTEHPVKARDHSQIAPGEGRRTGQQFLGAKSIHLASGIHEKFTALS